MLIFALALGAAHAAAPIINGEDATSDDYPATGGMIMDAHLDLGSYGEGDVRVFVCSSTLIAPDTILLAAHCLDEYAFTYGLGDMEINEIRWTRQQDLTDWDGTSYRKADWPEDSVVVSDWVANDEFDLRSMSTGIAENYDIALLFLEEPITDVDFVYLPTEDETDQVEEGAEVTVVGWGLQQQTATGETPEEGTYALKQMGTSVVGEVGDAEFQVGPDEDDVRKCHGDSGGPTFIEVETDSPVTQRLVGVTSHAYDRTDCNSKGGVDTRVQAYREWIETEMSARCEDGTRSWCEETGIPKPPEPEPVAEDDGDSDDTGVGFEDDDGKRGGCSTGGAGSAGGLFSAMLAGMALARRRMRRA